jgi:hypothetical protein
MNKNVKKSIIGISLLTATSLFTGCVGSMQDQRTPEEIAFSNQMKMELMKKLKEGLANMNVNQSAAYNEKKESDIAQTNYITEEELKNRLSSFPTINEGVKFTKHRDGFSVNDKSIYLDPEGEIINYGYNWQNGDVTYMIKTGTNSFKIKYTRALVNKLPIEIASVSQNGNIINVKTVTGKKYSSDNLILTSTGFISVRNESAFIYDIGEDSKMFTTPKGWHIARFQNGDVASTKYLLLERTIDPSKKGNPLFDFIESSKDLLSTFGVLDKHDYMLINIEDPTKKISFDISLSSKDIALYSNCQKANRYINKCANVDFKESLYTVNGLPNSGHYYWRVLWFSTKNGAISATREATQRKVMITDLVTGKRVEGAYRVTGFPELFAQQDKNGKIKVTAGGGMFPDEVIEDAEELLKNTPVQTAKN